MFFRSSLSVNFLQDLSLKSGVYVFLESPNLKRQSKSITFRGELILSEVGE